MAIVAVSVLAVSLFSTPVHAVSSFDDTVELGMNEVSFTDSGVFRAKFVTEAIFDELVVNSSDPECQAGYAGYEDADIRGAFQEVSAYTYESMQYSTVTFFWADTTTPENVMSAQDDGSIRYLGLDISYLTDAGNIIFSFGYVNGSGPLVIADCFNGNDSIMSVPIYDFALNPYSLYASDPTIYRSHWRKPLFLEGDVVYPAGYEGITIPLSYELNPRYVAMGDSFSSGEGNPPFEPGTDTSDNKCHRSSQAYPRLLQNDPDLNLGSMAFVACSGATTDSIVYGGNVVSSGGEDPQMSVLSSSTRIVTVTIGGNDVKFKEFASACVVTSCASSSSAYQESWDIMTNASNVDYLPNKLETAYAAIAEGLTAANTAARVYVIGYPKVVTHDSWASTTSSDPWNCLYMSENSSSGAEAIVQKLNEVIHDAVENFDDQRFVYVDPLATGSPFIGNELCRSGGYFYGASSASIFGGEDAYVFHPNVNGQNAYRQIVGDAIN